MSNTLNMSQELKDEFVFIEGKENYTLVDGVYVQNNVDVPMAVLTYAKQFNGKTVVIDAPASSGELNESVLYVGYIDWFPRHEWKRTDDSAINYIAGEEVIHKLGHSGNEIEYINVNKMTVEVSLEDLAE